MSRLWVIVLIAALLTLLGVGLGWALARGSAPCAPTLVAPCTPATLPQPRPDHCRQLLGNASFEDDSDWQLTGPPSAAYSREHAFSGARSLCLRLERGPTGPSLVRAEQPVLLPPGPATAILCLWYRVSAGSSGSARAYVSLRCPVHGSQVLGDLDLASESWAFASFDTGAFLGRSLVLELVLQRKGLGAPTVLYLDDLQWVVCPQTGPPSTPSPAAPAPSATPSPPGLTRTVLPTPAALLATPADLFVSSSDIWTEPATIRQGNLVSVGVTVRNASDRAVANVEVEILAGPRGAARPVGGLYTLPTIGPYGTGVINTGLVWHTAGLPWLAEVGVRVDPRNAIAEAREDNNASWRPVMVLPATLDPAPPRGELTIAGGSQTVSDRAITCSLQATDDICGTGVKRMCIAELGLNPATRHWEVVAQSGWVPYAASYPWTLHGPAGIKYLAAWFVDGAGNTSRQPAWAAVNYLPPTQAIATGEWHVYRWSLSAGTSVEVSLSSASGDSDLYLWQPGSLVAGATGVYQVQVHGCQAGTYSLRLATGSASPAAAPAGPPSAPTEKPLPAAPFPAGDPLAERIAAPAASHNVHLPWLDRMGARAAPRPAGIILPQVLSGAAGR